MKEWGNNKEREMNERWEREGTKGGRDPGYVPTYHFLERQSTEYLLGSAFPPLSLKLALALIGEPRRREWVKKRAPVR